MRQIKGWPDYFITDQGRLFSVKYGKAYALKGKLDKRVGYRYAHFRESDREAYRAIHRLVLTAFQGPPENADMECRHLDGDPSNNALDNLAWGTSQENAQDMVRHGTSTKGENNPRAKLTHNDVVQIKKRLKDCDSLQAVADEFDVTKSNIWYIKSGKTWKHVTIEDGE